MYIGRRAPLIAATLVVLMFAGSVGGAYALTGTTSGDLAERYVATLAGAVRADVNIDFGAGTLIVGPLPEASADVSVRLHTRTFKYKNAGARGARAGRCLCSGGSVGVVAITPRAIQCSTPSN